MAERSGFFTVISPDGSSRRKTDAEKFVAARSLPVTQNSWDKSAFFAASSSKTSDDIACVEAMETPAVRGAIVNARGPWRMSGNWWSEDVFNRDRWDVALESGALYRLFQEIDSRRWFVEGSYD